MVFRYIIPLKKEANIILYPFSVTAELSDGMNMLEAQRP